MFEAQIRCAGLIAKPSLIRQARRNGASEERDLELFRDGLYSNQPALYLLVGDLNLDINRTPQPELMGFDRERMKSKAASLAAKGVFIGTSS